MKMPAQFIKAYKEFSKIAMDRTTPSNFRYVYCAMRGHTVKLYATNSIYAIQLIIWFNNTNLPELNIALEPDKSCSLSGSIELKYKPKDFCIECAAGKNTLVIDYKNGNDVTNRIAILNKIITDSGKAKDGVAFNVKYCKDLFTLIHSIQPSTAVSIYSSSNILHLYTDDRHTEYISSLNAVLMETRK